MATFQQRNQPNELLIPQLVSKIEQLIHEISKLSDFSNNLLDQIRLHEIQQENMRKQCDDLWNLLPEDRKIQYNLIKWQYNYSTPKSYLELSRFLTKPETSKPARKREFMPTVHTCLECKSKDQQIEILKAQINKQTQVIADMLSMRCSQIEMNDQAQSSSYYRTATETEPQRRNRTTNNSMTSLSTKHSQKPFLISTNSKTQK